MSCGCSGMREKVSSRQAISIMCHRPDTTVEESVSTVVLYMHRDGCCNQNRNVTLSNDVAGYASAKKKTVFQRFLEKGHTFIEVDSVQSVIENKMRGREIFWPAEYVWLTSCTCQDLPYLVKQVDHVSFKDYSKLSHLSSCRPGISLGNPQVVDLRCLQYHPDGSTVSYKLNYSNKGQSLPQRKGRSMQQSTAVAHNLPLTAYRFLDQGWSSGPPPLSVVGQCLGFCEVLPAVMLLAHVFFCLPLCRLPWSVFCRIVFDRPFVLVTWPYHFNFLFVTVVRRSSNWPCACLTFCRTSSLVTWSLYEMPRCRL